MSDGASPAAQTRWQRIAARLDAYERLIRLDKPIGTLLLLWPTLSALWIAYYGSPSWIVVGIFVADGSLHPARRQLDADERADAVQAARHAGSNLQDVSLMTPDGTDLKAWLIQPAKPIGNAVMRADGYFSAASAAS